jgi:hypothetical protein
MGKRTQQNVLYRSYTLFRSGRTFDGVIACVQFFRIKTGLSQRMRSRAITARAGATHCR